MNDKSLTADSDQMSCMLRLTLVDILTVDSDSSTSDSSYNLSDQSGGSIIYLSQVVFT